MPALPCPAPGVYTAPSRFSPHPPPWGGPPPRQAGKGPRRAMGGRHRLARQTQRPAGPGRAAHCQAARCLAGITWLCPTTPSRAMSGHAPDVSGRAKQRRAWTRRADNPLCKALPSRAERCRMGGNAKAVPASPRFATPRRAMPVADEPRQAVPAVPCQAGRRRAGPESFATARHCPSPPGICRAMPGRIGFC